MENPARNDAHATQAGLKKQRGKTAVFESNLGSKEKEGANDLAFLSYRLSLSELISLLANKGRHIEIVAARLHHGPGQVI
jgi:hypothetical protein